MHSNNRHTQGVRVFSKVECLFKHSLLQPWSAPLTLPVPLEDLKDPSSRPITLPLGARPAKILCCKFYFADPWLLISEISFLSGRSAELKPSVFPYVGYVLYLALLLQRLCSRVTHILATGKKCDTVAVLEVEQRPGVAQIMAKYRLKQWERRDQREIVSVSVEV